MYNRRVGNNPMSLRRHFLFYCFLSLVGSSSFIFPIREVSALPFTRSKATSVEEEGGSSSDSDNISSSEEKKEIVVISRADGEVELIEFEKSGSNGDHRSHVVESYFAEDSTIVEYDQSSSLTADDELNQEINRLSNSLIDFLRTTRRNLHKIPELMYQEKETSNYIQKTLNELDISYTTGWSKNIHHPNKINGVGGYGIVADIGTGSDPCVLLRADIDALPILEQTQGVDQFVSQNPGTMHACGHDGHTTMLLGAAAILKSVEKSINGTVRLIFQPAEEGGAGAKRMIEEGVLDLEPKPQYAFGMHVWPTLESGKVATKPGPLLAAQDVFDIEISGVGGHGAMPHLTIDPIVTASSIVMNLQTIVSRTINPLESGVVSVTKVAAGEAHNIIPAGAVMRGTIRALSTESLLKLKAKFERIVTTTAKMYGCNTTITYGPDFYPPTVNDHNLYHTFSKKVGALIDDENSVREIDYPTMGAEDFAFLTERIPSTFFLLGQGSGIHPPTNYGLHHPQFALHEDNMPRGVELHVNLALRALKMIAINGGAINSDEIKEEL